VTAPPQSPESAGEHRTPNEQPAIPSVLVWIGEPRCKPHLHITAGLLKRLVKRMMKREKWKEKMVVNVGNIEPLRPKSLAEVRHHPKWPEWEKGICQDIKTLKDAGMWELADLPDGVNLIGSSGCFASRRILATWYYATKLRRVFSSRGCGLF